MIYKAFMDAAASAASEVGGSPEGKPGIRSNSDISEALGLSIDRGGLMLDESQLGPDFFDLRTGLAGEVLQKFTNYRARLAIVLVDPGAYGARFGELVHEHRNHRDVRFFTSEQLARQWLSYNPVTRC